MKCEICGNDLAMLDSGNDYEIYLCPNCYVYYLLKDGEFRMYESYTDLVTDLYSESKKTKKSRKKRRKRKKAVNVVLEEEFDSGLEIHEQCPYMKNVKIYMPRDVYMKVKALIEVVDDSEWLAFLDFEEDGNDVVIKDIIIPKQETTSASVEVDKDDSSKYPKLGVIHYHPHTGHTHFSVTDDEYINSNRPFSIVVTKDMNFKAVVRRKVPCGHILIADATVEVFDKDYEDIKNSIEKEVKEKIKSRVEVQYPYPYYAWRRENTLI